MRLRQLVLACGFSTFALSQFASALGLGEVTLKSALNQPLEAEIKLLDTGDLSPEQILISLASPADFERNGIERTYFYSELQFDVDLKAPGGPKVIVTSRSPVREPYLNFLIEARWTAGRLLREYTLLMDLPTFTEGAATAAVAAPSKRSSSIAEPPKNTSPQTYHPVSTSGSTPSTGKPSPKISGDQYKVRANDTLWEIAEGVRGSSGASVHQAMIALYEANPEAFINGNINLLRRGQILRIPDAQEMTSTSRSAAVRQFAQQIQDSGLGAQLNASRRTDTAHSVSKGVSGSVKLTAPSVSTGTGQGSGSNQGSGAGLETELAATLEELDKSKAENSELSSRVKDLEAQIATMEQLVAVSNEKMRALQLAAEQQNSATSQAVSADSASIASSLSSAVPIAGAVALTSAESSVVASASSSAASKAAVTPVVAASKKVVAPPPEPTAVDVLVENAPWLGLGGLVLGLGGYLFYRRRKEAEQVVAEDNFDPDVFAMDSELQPEEPQEEFDESLALDEQSEFVEEAPVEAETGDAVAEAEIYIAYGQLDKAEDLLQNALKKDPDASEVRLKLLEVYSHKQDLTGFDKEYALLAAVAGGALLTRAAELRAAIPGAEASELPLPVSDSADSSVAEDFNFADLDLTDDTDSFTSESQASVDLADEPLDFDLDLGEDFAEAGDEPLADSSFSLDDEDEFAAVEAPQSLGVDSEELDFSIDQDLGDLEDLDLDLGEEGVSAEAEDLSDLSVALDELNKPTLPEDISTASNSIDDEFSFDLEDDVNVEALAEDGSGTAEPEAAIDELESGSLDVSADDFNLDMNVDDVDLAALDHEMEALDLEIEPQEDVNIGVSTLNELPLNLDDDEEFSGLAAELDSEDFAGLDLNEEIPESGLSLTDDLDQFAAPGLQEGEDSNELLADLAASELEATSAEEAGSEDEFGLDFEMGFDASDAGLDEGLALAEADEELPALAEDDVFSAALSEFDEGDVLSLEQEEDEGVALSDDDIDSELDFLADTDEAATKLDLARAYIDMGDTEGARDILSEVIAEGNDQQRGEAEDLLSRIQA